MTGSWLEWLIATDSKSVGRACAPWVRIPPLPATSGSVLQARPVSQVPHATGTCLAGFWLVKYVIAISYNCICNLFPSSHPSFAIRCQTALKTLCGRLEIVDRRDDHALIRRCGAPSPPPPLSPNDDRASARHAYAWRADSGTRRYAAERGARSQRPRLRSTPGRLTPPNRRHDSASSATYPPTRPRQSRLMLSAISPAGRRQSGSAHCTAPGRYAYLRSLSRPLPLRSCSSCHRSRTASCPGRSSPSASST